MTLATYVAVATALLLAGAAHGHALGHKDVSGGAGVDYAGLSGEREHHCIHDTPAVQRLMHTGMDIVAPQFKAAPRKGDRAGVALATGPLRILVSAADLNTTGQYCAAIGDTVPDFQGSTTTCATSDDLLTTAKKDILLNQILPAAQKVLADALNVVQLTTGGTIASSACSGYFTIPAAYQTSPGAENMDYVLIVASTPMSGSTVAWAGACSIGSDNRAVVGRMNVGTSEIAWGTDNRQIVMTIVHEILHALGFSGSMITNYFANKDTRTIFQTVTRRGKSVNQLATTEVVKETKAQFGCDTLTGGEFEDEGGSGTSGSHWERRNNRNDVMAGVVGREMRLSRMTLAVMADSGHWYPDMSKAEYMAWGNNAGCSFITSACNVNDGKYWCNGTVDRCTGLRKAEGYCAISSSYTADLASYFQYFTDARTGGTSSLMDYCPVMIAYSNRRCTSTTYSKTSSDTFYGEYFGDGGRCYTAQLAKSGTTFGTNLVRCLYTRCLHGTQVQLNPGSNVSLGWTSCPTDGSALNGVAVNTSSGYTGTVDCPPASEVCGDGALHWPPVATTATPTTSTPTTTAAGATTASPSAAGSSMGTSGSASAASVLAVLLAVCAALV
jgi:leishmanolysin